MTKKSYHHGDLPAALLDAADHVLQNQGLQGFTLRACARHAGVSHAAPKHHFGDVRGLLSAVAARGFANLVSYLQRSIDEVRGDLDEEMYATASAYVKFAQDYPEHFRIMFRADIVTWDKDSVPDSVTHTFLVLTNVILRQRGETELDSERLRQPIPQALVNDIIIGWCHIHGYAHLRMEGQLNIVPEQDHQHTLHNASVRLAQLIQRCEQ